MKGKTLILLFISVSFIITFSVLWIARRYTAAQSQQFLEKAVKEAGHTPVKGIFYTVDHKNKRIVRWNGIVE